MSFQRWFERCECVWWSNLARETVPDRWCSIRKRSLTKDLFRTEGRQRIILGYFPTNNDLTSATLTLVVLVPNLGQHMFPKQCTEQCIYHMYTTQSSVEQSEINNNTLSVSKQPTLTTDWDWDTATGLAKDTAMGMWNWKQAHSELWQ